MNWSNYVNLLIIICLSVGCQPQKKESTSDQPAVTKYLIEADELLSIINHDSITLLDLQRPEDFLQGHLPYAINLWRSALNNPAFNYDGMMPDQHLLEKILQNKGVKRGDFLVLYDNRGSCEATRLWWLLKHYGYDRMTILNGGTQAWLLLDTLTKTTASLNHGDFKFPDNTVEQPSNNILMADLSEMMSRNQLVVLDTRSKEENEGITLKNGARWAGKIPNSIHIDWMGAVDQTTYKFKALTDLHKIYKEILNDDRLAITYCHSGVRSTHTYFVLTELLGRKNVKNYDGSWVEWSHHFEPEIANK